MTGKQLWRQLADVPQLPGSVVTIGNFDGVHLGHQYVLDQVVQHAEAAETDLWPVALTFSPHPKLVMAPDQAPKLIASYAQRDELLFFYGMRAVFDIDFTWDFAQFSAEDFVKTYLVDALKAKVVVLGADARFGKGNSGDIDTMRQLGEEYGFKTVTVSEQGLASVAESRVSSTAIRACLEAGEVGKAAEMLGRPHVVSDMVHHGYKRGRELGFPTANLGVDPQGLVPADGVYAGILTVTKPAPGCAERGDAIAGAMCTISVGTNPTFADDEKPQRTVEAFVHGRQDLDLYDSEVSLSFIAYQRPTLRFSSVDDLIAQMHEDVLVTSRTIEQGGLTGVKPA